MVNTVPVEPVVEKNYDHDIFKKFMQQIPVQSYANQSQEDFIYLTDDEKKAIIRQYYNDMKSRRIFSGKRHDIFALFDTMLGQGYVKTSVLKVRSKQHYFCCALGHGIAPIAALGALEKANMLLMTRGNR